MTELIAVILAAGEGRRMGGPKALLAWDGGTLVEAHLRAALAAGCTRAVGVVRESVRDRVRVPDGAELVVSFALDEVGPAGSLAAFVTHAEIADDVRVAISPVDVHPAAWNVVASLSRAMDGPGTVAVTPTHGGRGGHPVLVRASVLTAYRAATPPTLRDVLRALGASRVAVPTSIAEVITDMDRPEDVPQR